MKHWIMVWLRGWCGQQLVVDSPLGVDEASRRLADGLVSRRAAVYTSEHGYGSASVIFGQLSGNYLTARVLESDARNPWRFVLNGQLEATDTGCRLVCELGWHPMSLVVGVVGAAIPAMGGAAGLATTAVDLVAGHASAAAAPATVAAACIGLALFFSIMGILTSRDDEPRLRGWVTDRLQL